MGVNLERGHRKRNYGARALALFFAYMAVAMCFGVWLLAKHHELIKNSATTTATILQTDRNFVAYGFRANGSNFQGSESGSHYKGPNVVGSPVEVTYSLKDPTVNTLTPDFNYSNGRLSLAIGLGGILVVSALILIAKLNLYPKFSVVIPKQQSDEERLEEKRRFKSRQRIFQTLLFSGVIGASLFSFARSWIPFHRIESHPASTIGKITRLDSDSGEITYQFPTPKGLRSASTNTKSYWGQRAVGLGVIVDYATDDPNISMLDLEQSKRKIDLSLLIWVLLAILFVILIWLLPRLARLPRNLGEKAKLESH